MLKFEGFPEGDDLWMVKCIDRFRIPHAMTESASVDVRLQRVKGLSAQQAARADARQIHDFFGGTERGPDAFLNVRVHAASLPALRVGQLFQNGEYRVELPTQSITVELPLAEKSGRAYILNDQLTPPPGWSAKHPYRLLTTREFDLCEADWRSHRVLLVKEKGDRDVILPRTVIFQRCYGPHSEMADAFTSGPWPNVRRRLVSDADFENGLKTRIAPELGEWHLVLQTLIPDDFRWHVALFAFDPYAERQARALFSEAQVQRAERGRQRNDASWFCPATLPYDPNYPLTLRLKGYGLRPSLARPQGAFLVTSILGIRLGQPLPRLAYNRANAGSEAPDVQDVDAPQPFGGKGGRNRNNSDRRMVGSTHAADTGGAVAGYNTDTFDWDGPLDERVLEKTSSKHYTGAKQQPAKPVDGPDSTAKPLAGGQAGRHLQASAQVRPRVAHFDNLIDCLTSLRDANRIDRFDVIQPENADLRAERGGLLVWDLTEEEVRRSRQRPKRWWRMLTPRGSRDDSLVGRTVLIVEVRWKMFTALLFEVECRRSEQGYCMAAMIFNGAPPPSQDAVCVQMMFAIVATEGRHLGAAAHTIAFGFGGRGDAYRHRYLPTYTPKTLDPNSLMAFLIKDHSKTASANSNDEAAAAEADHDET